MIALCGAELGVELYLEVDPSPPQVCILENIATILLTRYGPTFKSHRGSPLFVVNKILSTPLLYSVHSPSSRSDTNCFPKKPDCKQNLSKLFIVQQRIHPIGADASLGLARNYDAPRCSPGLPGRPLSGPRRQVYCPADPSYCG